MPKAIATALLSVMLIVALVVRASALTPDQTRMMVRLSEIEIAPEYLEEYLQILKKESAASVRLEPGVISIFPMSQREQPTQVRILEIYADRAAYESHLQTQHFQEYKTTTMKMVKSLRLVDMQALDEESMRVLFAKLR
jgi:quinol monooxygenase YgiN